eukprot:CAMPEP_0172477058 /NCGR_PEP_ID=MMETSP1065-20121228/70698_1 /TAXON_ID=265537 /ORGANISM="Amphiprora paludosa, Strain CCMP125" /LENGTH=344 /DNA_ID=CAMNT_0013235297 /DNA_START=82 /DNA_END=1116 /DNA_ORIENTATION=+
MASNNSTDDSNAAPTADDTATPSSETAELNRQNEARLQEIEQNIRENQPLTSEQLPLTALEKQYLQESTASNFRQGVTYLQNHYSHLRMVRGDGNCYYRAFLYSLVEQLLNHHHHQDPTAKAEGERICQWRYYRAFLYSLVEQLLNHHQDPTAKAEGDRICQWLKHDSWQQVLNIGGYDEMTCEIFYDSMVELLEKVVSSAPKTGESSSSYTMADFHEEMNQETATSDYCTWYMRVITATHLKSHPDRFLPFILAEQPGLDIPQYCQREIEPMGKECEMLQALALAEAFGVQVQIEYLDGHALQTSSQGDKKLSQHNVGSEEPKLFLKLLYRPGHYDILYPISK